MSALEEAVRCVVADLGALRRRFVLVGGLAVSARTEPRFTRDVDLAVLVDGDAEAEALGQSFRLRGYLPLALVEQTERRRLETLRLVAPRQDERGIVVDLLFASSGIEAEVVAQGEPVEIFPGVFVPVARVGHLLALKLLSRDDLRRPQDFIDLRALMGVATQDDLTLARESAALISQRGYARDRDLCSMLEQLVAQPV
ncbi:MAG: nucleotidyl transferase AbiEii/AbiGii toxin family protein [Deltaproteobacteria bacterium]|nr:nucleotidyl transferase AbiEii/AbiGii toxin family protein [Deltaproteobacteria bacterium]